MLKFNIMKALIFFITTLLFLLHSIPIIAYFMTKEPESFVGYVVLGVLDIMWGSFIDNNKNNIK